MPQRLWIPKKMGPSLSSRSGHGPQLVWRKASAGGSFIVATGGTITTDGDYKVHTFTTSGTFEVTANSGNVWYVVVAGGGGGGVGVGGGGGAGGYLSNAAYDYAVTV